MRSRVVLVLGAGASVAMGYPVGSGLRSKIIEHSSSKYLNVIARADPGIDRDQIALFSQAFRDSQMVSIDAFLARRPEFVNIGKLAIAAVLLDHEDPATLHTCPHDDNWYQYFFNRIAAQSWDGLKLDHYAIVTFNYDRSLEHYLLGAMTASYNRSLDECYQKIRELKILHVYGTLGSCDPSAAEYFAYGRGVSRESVAIAASMLRVIPEGRKDDETLAEARRLLLETDHIAFLGFGFDESNLERLDSTVTCSHSVRREDGVHARRIVATCLNMSVAETLRAAHLTRGSPQSQEPRSFGFYDINCVSLLRDTLVLG